MLAARIALRYLFARKRHTAVNVISLISLAGVAVATAAIVVVLSVFNGFADLGASQASSVDPDLLVSPKQGKTIAGADSIARVISSLPGVRAVAPVVLERGLVMSGNAQVPVHFKGVPSNYDSVVAVDRLVIDGVFCPDSAVGVPAANISVGVAYHGNIQAETDRSLRLYVPRRSGRINTVNPAASFRADTFLVWSVLRSDVQQFDADYVLLPIAVARNLLDYSHEATAIEISLTGSADAESVQRQIETILPQVDVADRLRQQSEAFRMIAIEKWMTFLLLIFILIIASFNVVSTLSLLVVEKQADMEVMRFLGAAGRTVRSVFEWQGWMISMLGGLVGIALGSGLVLLQQSLHIIKLNADESALTINYYPVRLAWPDLLLVLAVVAVVSLLAGQTTRFFQKQK